MLMKEKYNFKDFNEDVHVSDRGNVVLGNGTFTVPNHLIALGHLDVSRSRYVRMTSDLSTGKTKIDVVLMLNHEGKDVFIVFPPGVNFVSTELRLRLREEAMARAYVQGAFRSAQNVDAIAERLVSQLIA